MFKSRFDARGRLLRAGLAACLITTGATIAAPAPVAGAAEERRPEARPSGQASVNFSAQRNRETKVAYGKRVRLGGRVAPARSVRLEHAPTGESWRMVAQTTARSDGSYRFAVKARTSGAYRAVADSGQTTAPRRVVVVAQLVGRSTRHVLGSGAVRVRGRLVPGLGGRRVRLELRTGGGWKAVDRARTASGGRFSATFRPRRPGAYRLHMRFGGDRQHAAGSRALPRVYVYRPGGASWYGPGFMGNRTACGRTLTGSVRGVAHQYLPCGTKVRLYYRGRSVTATVIDRGPFHASRSWDLAPATKRALGFGSTGTVWSTR